MRSVPVDEPVRAGGDALVPCREEHVLRGTARVERHRPLPGDDHRDDEARDAHVVRREDGVREGLDPVPALGHDERPRLPVLGRAREPARIENPRDDVVRQALGVVPSLVSPAGDREECVHPTSRSAPMTDQAKVSLLRWLRRQLRQPTPQRERLEAAVANDDPAEARRLLATFDFTDAQRRHVEGLLEEWERGTVRG